MSNYTASKKSNVIFIKDRKSKDAASPQAARDSEFVTDSSTSSLVTTCGIGDKVTNQVSLTASWARLNADLTAFADGLLEKKALAERWPSERRSWRAMRYNRTGPNGNCTRHPAFDTFPSFLSHVGPKHAPKDSLDKLDPSNPEYGPGLVRWASKSVQTHNRRNTRMLTDSQGHTYSLSQWSRKTGLSASTIAARLDSGKTVDDAVYTRVGGFSRESAPPANTGEFVTLWKVALKKSHGQEFFAPQGKDYKLLQQVVDAFAEGKVWPAKALEFILTNWSKFTRFAESEYGAWQKPPSVPTIAYLHANIQAAGNFYLDSTKTVASVSHKAETMFELPIQQEPESAPACDDDLLAELEKYDV